jgi:ribosomal protein S18 acetylase RimI-like enzyme
LRRLEMGHMPEHERFIRRAIELALLAEGEGNLPAGEGTILGLVTARRLGDDAAVISRLYVSPPHQRQGIGSRLLQESTVASSGIRRLLVQVEEQNTTGLSFYRKQGFEEISRKDEKVEDQILRVIEMEKKLL